MSTTEVLLPTPIQKPAEKFGPGYMGVITADLSRYPEFWVCFLQALRPEGTMFNHIMGNGFAGNRNLLIKDMYQKAPESEWIWMIDDDHVFAPELVMSLLSKQKDIIQPLCFTRKPPFMAYGYNWKERDDGSGEGDFWGILLEDLPESGLLQVDAVGAGGMLIRREVLDAMGDPWFEEGKLDKGTLGEDLHFCKKARDLGFECYVDTDSPMGHIGKMEVWPQPYRSPNAASKWSAALNLLHGVGCTLPPHFGEDKLKEF